MGEVCGELRWLACALCVCVMSIRGPLNLAVVGAVFELRSDLMSSRRRAILGAICNFATPDTLNWTDPTSAP